MKISKKHLAKLNSGECSTGNLMEILAVDFEKLKCTIFERSSSPVVAKNAGFLQKMQLYGEWVAKTKGRDGLDLLATHKSDTARGWACYGLVSKCKSFNSALEHIISLADDTHFGVREWAWLAIRPLFIKDLNENIKTLEELSYSDLENLRRFASELSRPRGVWCQHIKEFKHRPELGFSIIENLNNDPAKYVQNSVGNWLNDASKDNPNFVSEVCRRWSSGSATAATKYICKRALRTISRKTTCSC